MSENVIIFGSLCLATIFIIIMTVAVINSKKKKVMYYNYKIKYDVSLDKYDQMLMKQRKIIWRKKVYLSYLKFLARMRGK